jgi:hypothetical protein
VYDGAVLTGSVPVEQAPRRWLPPVVWILSGFAVGLLFHRYVILPFDRYVLLPFDVASMGVDGMTWIAGGLLTTAAIVSSRMGGATPGAEAPRGVSLARLGLGCAGALAAMGLGFAFAPPLGFLPLRARALPGFEIALPSGNEDGSLASDYANGKLWVKRPGGFTAIVQLYWEPGDVDAETTDALIQGLAASFGHPPKDVRANVHTSMPPGLRSRSLSARFGDAEFWITLVPCGTRHLTIVTTGQSWGAERLHQRIAGSLRCRPDPSKEGLDVVPVIVDVGAGWFRSPSRTGVVQLTNASELFIAQAQLGDVAESSVEVLKSGRLVPGLEVGARQNDRWPLVLRAQGAARHGWLRALPCTARHVTLLIWWLAADDGPHHGKKLLDSVRCQKADEPAQVWPRELGSSGPPP